MLGLSTVDKKLGILENFVRIHEAQRMFKRPGFANR